MEDPDRDLVARAKRGDSEAFGTLVRRHQHRLVNYARALVNHPSDAEDVAQEAFLRAYRALGAFKGMSSFRTWLYRIATNEARTQLARRHARPEASAVEHAAGETPPVERLAGRDDIERSLVDRDRIDRALGTLPLDLREAVVLRDVEGLEYREIADALEIPIGTVESRIFRGRARLRRALGERAVAVAGSMGHE